MGFFNDPFINWKRVRNFSIMAVIVWSLAIFLIIEDNKPDQKRVVLLLIDGLRPDAIKRLGPAQAPNFHYLMRTGASTLNARSDLRSSHTLPNSVSILTGRPVFDTPAAHKNSLNRYVGRSIHDVRDEYIYSVFDITHEYNLRSSLFASKNKFGIFIKSYTNPKYTGPQQETGLHPARIQSYNISDRDDETTFKYFLNELVNFESSFIFVHLAGPDTAGHQYGWDLAPGSGYISAVRDMDKYLGKLLKTIHSRRNLRGNVHLIITADHGGSAEGHDDIFDPLNYTIPFFVWGPDVAQGADLYELNAKRRRDPLKYKVLFTSAVQPIRSGEAGNLALSLLGLPPIPNSVMNGLQSLRVNIKE